MRFSVDAHAIGQHLTGNEVYVRNLLANFADLDRSSEFIAYLTTTDVDGWVPSAITRRPIARNPFLRLGYDLLVKLRQDRPDLIHVQYTAPLGCPVPVVASVHDVSFVEYPEYFPFPRVQQLRYTVQRTIRSAAKILTVSEFSKVAIMRAYGLDDGKIVVAPNAASSIFRPVSRENAAAWVFERHRIPGPFLLTVGDLQPRKNHIGLIQAFSELIRGVPELPHRLVIAGKETWFSNKVHKAAWDSGVADRIHFCGFVTDEDLLQLYNASEVFVFPSFYEGFGLPVIEAMACGCAVACSNTSALPEVADAAALLFDPHSIAEVKRAILDLILDRELLGRMQKLALHRASHFSWRKTAEKTLEVYYAVAGGGQQARTDRFRPASISAP